MIVIGDLSLRVALLFAAWACVTSFAGGALGRRDVIESGARGVYATWVLVLLASLGLWTALLGHDFSLRYVADVTSTNLPRPYTLTAFWADAAGRQLAWALALSTYAALAVWASRRQPNASGPYIAGTAAALTLLSLLVLCLAHDPYVRLEAPPADGRGLDPHLQNPSGALLPIALLLGYAATAIPLSLAIGGVLARHFDAAWRAAVQRWLLIAWVWLTVGMSLGMWSAYLDPRTNAQWLAAPIRNASLFPWLACTALAWTGRRMAARLAVAGLIFFGVGIGGAGLGQRAYTATLSPGAAYSVTDLFGHRWQFVSNGISQYDKTDQHVTAVAVKPVRDGRALPLIVSEERQYMNTQNEPVADPVVTAGGRSMLAQSVYVVATADDHESARLRLVFTPLLWCTWLGAALMAAAGLVALAMP